MGKDTQILKLYEAKIPSAFRGNLRSALEYAAGYSVGKSILCGDGRYVDPKTGIENVFPSEI